MTIPGEPVNDPDRRATRVLICPVCGTRRRRYVRALYCKDKCAWIARQTKLREPEQYKEKYLAKIERAMAERAVQMDHAKELYDMSNEIKDSTGVYPRMNKQERRAIEKEREALAKADLLEYRPE